MHIQNPDQTVTTGFPNFAECQLHSAKDRLHSAKYLPSVTLGKESHGNADFAECRITGTRQRICRVPWHSANKPRGATPGPALCRVSNGRHSVKCPRQGAATRLFYRVLALGKKHSAKRVSVYLISMKLVNFRSMYAVHQFKEK